MLCARDENGNIVNLLKAIPEKGIYTCPACNSRVRLKQGQIKMPHFAHLSLQGCTVWSENESVQHLTLKKILYQWFYDSGCAVEIEKYLPQLRQTPDLLVNEKIAIEVQCSPLSIRRLRERTINYQKGGYVVIWLLGQDLWLTKSITALQCDLIYFSKNCGFYCWELDLLRKQLRLKALLHQSLSGQLIYLTREFEFACGNLLDILRQPYLSQHLMSLSVNANKNLQQFISHQLYYRQPRWLAIQEKFYLQGRNLLTESLNGPQFAPIGLEILTGEMRQDFCQLTKSMNKYYQNFQRYYQENKQTKVYSPAFYDKMNKWKHTMNSQIQ